MEMTTVVTAAWYAPRPVAPAGSPFQGSGVPAGRLDAVRLRGLRGIATRGTTATEPDSHLQG